MLAAKVHSGIVSSRSEEELCQISCLYDDYKFYQNDDF